MATSFVRIGDVGIVFGATSYAIDLSSGAPPPSGDITVALAPSRTSGPAPLAVHFSAVGTTSSLAGVSDTFRQLLYTFDYGDPGAGTWPISGGSKNSDVGGPLGAHVFETPGTYVVRCTGARGADSNYQEVTITVTDPATVFSGTNTVYISPSANYAGAPAGAETRTTVPTIVSGKRYMFRRGESFGALTIPHGVTGTQVVAAGSGAKPAVSSIAIGTAILPPDSNFPNDITVADLQSAGDIVQNISARRILLLNVDQPSSSTITLTSAEGYWAESVGGRYGPTMPYSRELFLVGGTSVGNTSAMALTGNMIQSAVLGCDIKGASQHAVRFWFAVELFMAHNDLSGPSSDGIRHTLKIHSNGSLAHTIGSTYAAGTTFASSKGVIANNVFSDTDDNNAFPVVLGPENDIVAQGLEDFILENNRFKVGPNLVADASLAGRRMTAITNTRYVGGAAASVSMPGLHSAGLPESWGETYFTSRT